MNSTVLLGDIHVNRIGLGTNRLTDTGANLALLNKAVELGIQYIDTANIYTKGESEKTLGNALSPFPENLVIGTKGGMVPGSPANNDPVYLSRCIDESLDRLKTKCITLYQLHRVDPGTPVEDTMRFLNDMQAEGKIKYIGLTEVTIEQAERARKITEIVSIQNHYNLITRKHDEVVDYCEKNKIIFMPYFPLDKGKADSEMLGKIAKKYSATQHQIALAWLLKRSPVMLPIPGTLSMQHLADNAAALNISLSGEDFDALNAVNKYI